MLWNVRRAGLAFALSGLATPLPAGPEPDLAVEPYTFEARDGTRVEAELGRLRVPENRRQPDTRRIELAFVRFRARSPNPGAPIVYLAGGPGNSGIDTARGARFPFFMALREAGDVIALDQRGVGLSRPELTCPQPLGYPLDRPGERAELLRLYVQRSRECAAHWTAQGVDLLGYDTEQNADDLEDLRRALGAPQLRLWATSYGTHLALAAVRRHAASVERIVLHGVEGPDHTYKLPGVQDAILERIAALARADKALAPDAAQLVAVYRAVLANLAARPVEIEVARPGDGSKARIAFGAFDAQRLVAAVIAGDPGYAPAVLAALHRRDVSSPLLRHAGRRFGLEVREGSIGSAMAFMTDCASGASPQRWSRIVRAERAALLGRVVDFPFPEVCEGWGRPDLGPAFRAVLRSQVPALFVSGTLDARTPPSNTAEVRRGFPRSAALLIEGAWHSDPLFLSSPRVLEAVLAFLKGQPVQDQRIAAPPLRFQAPAPGGQAP